MIRETRSKEKRNRLLPARLVVYYVIALALFFGEAYEEVMRRMVGGLAFLSAWERHRQVPTPSALCQARQRLGEQPLRALFERAALPLATPATIGAWLGDRRLMAVDGVTLDVPDTEQLLGALSQGMIVTLTLPVLRRLSDGSYLSAITPRRAQAPTTLAQAHTQAAAGKAVIVRVVEYQITDRDTATDPYPLITTITDSSDAPAVELAACYHQRWEFEISLDEIETHQIAHSRVLRSKTPDMVKQELWGILNGIAARPVRPSAGGRPGPPGCHEPAVAG